MSRQAIVQQWERLLTRWPVDRLRPEQQQFTSLIKARIAAAPKHGQDENVEIAAVKNLLDNAYTNRFPVSKQLMEPESKPAYYKDLAKELEEIPGRSWLGNLTKRLSTMIRWR